MNPLLIIALIVVVPWAAVVAVILAVLSHASAVGARIDAMAAHQAQYRPCPLCLAEGAALVDPDGVALCTECQCSYEIAVL